MSKAVNHIVFQLNLFMAAKQLLMPNDVFNPNLSFLDLYDFFCV